MKASKFQMLVKGKSIAQKCRLRLEHKAVLYYDDGKRTTSQIAKAVAIPVNLVNLFQELGLDVWDRVLHHESYCQWVDQEYDPTFGNSAREWEEKYRTTDNWKNGEKYA